MPSVHVHSSQEREGRDWHKSSCDTRIGTPSTLFNIGNSCYYNALIQCLFHTNLLPSGNYAKDTLAESLSSLNRKLEGKETITTSPIDVKKVVGRFKPEFGSSRQQDEAELFLLLSEMLPKELGQTSKFTAAVQGFLTSVIKCGVCLEITTEKQPFTQLQLAIPEHRRACTLQECWDSEFGESVLGDAICGFCGQIGSRVRNYHYELPQVLVVTLKRFCHDDHGSTKNNAYVEAPVHSWSPAEGGPTYSLAATVNHRGASIDSGHYVANCLRDKWYLVDDTRSQPILHSSVISQDNYILFYVCPP